MNSILTGILPVAPTPFLVDAALLAEAWQQDFRKYQLGFVGFYNNAFATLIESYSVKNL